MKKTMPRELCLVRGCWNRSRSKTGLCRYCRKERKAKSCTHPPSQPCF